MKYRLQKRAYLALGLLHRSDRTLIIFVGCATFFFGFFAGAVLNVYLLLIRSPLVESLRGSLSYKSAIFGDGVLLPLVNMLACAFLLKYKARVTKRMIQIALVSGTVVTLYFHVSQAVNKLVNWAMPSPWHWNALGVWHAVYMFAVASFLSLFYLIAIRVMKRERTVPSVVWIITLGIVLFFVLLRLDYRALDTAKIFFR